MRFLWKKIKDGTEELGQNELFLQRVSGEIEFDFVFAVLVVFSAVIATLGLLIDSVAVVIGGMLISPIAWPMFGLAASVTTTRKKLTQRSLVSLVLSVGLVLAVAVGLTYLVPGVRMTDEILARTNPTLLDLVIAMASAVIGVLAVYYPKISESLSGVAVSVALLPPLCVSGIGLARKNWEVFNGSFLLFAANLAAIVFVGVVTLYFLGFKPKREGEGARFGLGLVLSSLFIVALSVPLAIYLRESIRQAEVRRQVVAVLEEEVVKFDLAAVLEDVVVSFSSDGSEVRVLATVYLEEGNYLTNKQQDELVSKLVEETETGVNLQLSVVNTLLLRRQEEEEDRLLREEIRNFVAHELERIEAGVVTDEIKIGLKESGVEVGVSIHQSDELPFNMEQKSQMVEALETKFERDFEVVVEYLPVTRLGGVTQVGVLEKQIREYLGEKLDEFGAEVRVDKVSLDFSVEQLGLLNEMEEVDARVLGIQVLAAEVWVYAPSGFEIEGESVSLWEEELSEKMGFELGLEWRVVEYSDLN